MAEYINKEDLKFLEIPIAPVLQGEQVHIEQGFLKEWLENVPVADVVEIPEGATNGDMIKAMFPNLEIANDGLTNDNLTGIIAFYGGYNSPMPRGNNYFNRKWWNAPYRKEEE